MRGEPKESKNSKYYQSGMYHKECKAFDKKSLPDVDYPRWMKPIKRRKKRSKTISQLTTNA